MKLYIKQRVFSWFDSYDIYDEYQRPVFHIKGKLSFGHRFEVYDRYDQLVGEMKQEVFSLLPRFYFRYKGEEGEIKQNFTFFRQSYDIAYSDFSIEGDWLNWDYEISSASKGPIMKITKQLFNWSDTYELDIVHEEDMGLCLMIALAIDAANCSHG